MDFLGRFLASFFQMWIFGAVLFLLGRFLYRLTAGPAFSEGILRVEVLLFIFIPLLISFIVGIAAAFGVKMR